MACHLIIEDCCCDFELSEGLYREHEQSVSSLLFRKCFVIQTFFITNAILINFVNRPRIYQGTRHYVDCLFEGQDLANIDTSNQVRG